MIHETKTVSVDRTSIADEQWEHSPLQAKSCVVQRESVQGHGRVEFLCPCHIPLYDVE